MGNQHIAIGESLPSAIQRVVLWDFSPTDICMDLVGVSSVVSSGKHYKADAVMTYRVVNGGNWEFVNVASKSFVKAP